MSGLSHKLRRCNSSPVAAGARYWRLYANDVDWSLGFGDYQYLSTIAFFASSDGTGTDLNLSGTAAAQSTYSAAYLPSNACDGNSGTVWASTYNPVNVWWSIDFGVGNAYEVHSVKIEGLGLTYFSKSYKLQKSIDNSNWTDVATFSTANSGALQTIGNL